MVHGPVEQSFSVWWARRVLDLASPLDRDAARDAFYAGAVAVHDMMAEVIDALDDDTDGPIHYPPFIDDEIARNLIDESRAREERDRASTG